jgi:hypothetical protein
MERVERPPRSHDRDARPSKSGRISRVSSQRTTPEARIAHAETQCACILLILNDLLWRRGWESDCVHPLKAKSLAEFDFIHIR